MCLDLQYVFDVYRLSVHAICVFVMSSGSQCVCVLFRLLVVLCCDVFRLTVCLCCDVFRLCVSDVFRVTQTSCGVWRLTRPETCF